ncbi:MAG: hypothetical protein ACI9TF_001142 [Paracrocinitomix sp.]|jgi:hypothetical protein
MPVVVTLLAARRVKDLFSTVEFDRGHVGLRYLPGARSCIAPQRPLV